MEPNIPSESDYTTSTNPERFEVVIECARRIVEELCAGYVVERSECDWGVDLPRFGGWSDGCPSPVRLTPSTGAPIVFGYTSAPGVVIRVGPNVEVLFPDCLCDACNYQPDEMCSQLQAHVNAVTGGGFFEKVGFRFHEWSFATEGWAGSAKSKIRRGDRADLGRRGTYEYGPWERRAARSGSASRPQTRGTPRSMVSPGWLMAPWLRCGPILRRAERQNRGPRG